MCGAPCPAWVQCSRTVPASCPPSGPQSTLGVTYPSALPDPGRGPRSTIRAPALGAPWRTARCRPAPRTDRRGARGDHPSSAPARARIALAQLLRAQRGPCTRSQLRAAEALAAVLNWLICWRLRAPVSWMLRARSALERASQPGFGLEQRGTGPAALRPYTVRRQTPPAPGPCAPCPHVGATRTSAGRCFANRSRLPARRRHRRSHPASAARCRAPGCATSTVNAGRAEADAESWRQGCPSRPPRIPDATRPSTASSAIRIQIVFSTCCTECFPCDRRWLPELAPASLRPVRETAPPRHCRSAFSA